MHGTVASDELSPKCIVERLMVAITETDRGHRVINPCQHLMIARSIPLVSVDRDICRGATCEVAHPVIILVRTVINLIVNTYIVDGESTMVFEGDDNIVRDISDSGSRVVGVDESADATVIEQRCILSCSQSKIGTCRHSRTQLKEAGVERIEVELSVISYMDRTASTGTVGGVVGADPHSRRVAGGIVGNNGDSQSLSSIVEGVLKIDGTRGVAILTDNERRVIHHLLKLSGELIIAWQLKASINIAHLDNHTVTGRTSNIRGYWKT